MVLGSVSSVPPAANCSNRNPAPVYQVVAISTR